MRFLIVLLFITSLVTTTASAGEPVRVMSFNVRNSAAKDGDNRWELRRDLLAGTIKAFAPDVLGTQEVQPDQRAFLDDALDGLAAWGRSRQTGPGEQCTVYFRTDRFVQLAGGHFWLSETPHTVASKSWDSSLPRMATWVLLKDSRDPGGRPLLVLNTHFDHRGATSRVEAMGVIKQKLRLLQAYGDSPRLIVLGDFNTPPGSAPYNAIVQGDGPLVDTYAATGQEEAGTFNGFTGISDPARRIDWILADRSWTVKAAGIDRTSENGRYPSDHFPVTAVLE